MNEINRLVIATGNTHKTEEIRKLLDPFIKSIDDLQSYPEIGEIPETGSTFEDNAALKAIAVGNYLGDSSWVLSDESGHDDSALNGLTGDHGFGYDSIFIPEGFESTFAELPLEVKNSMSHRGRALNALKKWLSSGRYDR